MTFTAVTSLLPVEKYTRQRREHIDKMIEKSRQIFRYMEPRVPISSKALNSLHSIRSQVAIETEIRMRDDAEGSVIPSVEQDIDGSLDSFGGLGTFDWLANPTALLSRQTPGLNMSWLAGSDAWLTQAECSRQC